jgi:hypothetical protein
MMREPVRPCRPADETGVTTLAPGTGAVKRPSPRADAPDGSTFVGRRRPWWPVASRTADPANVFDDISAAMAASFGVGRISDRSGELSQTSAPADARLGRAARMSMTERAIPQAP